MCPKKKVSTISVNIMKKKIEITTDDHLSQTYEQLWQNQRCDIDYWIKTSLIYFFKFQWFWLFPSP